MGKRREALTSQTFLYLLNGDSRRAGNEGTVLNIGGNKQMSHRYVSGVLQNDGGQLIYDSYSVPIYRFFGTLEESPGP